MYHSSKENITQILKKIKIFTKYSYININIFIKKKLTIRATKRVLKGSAVTFGIPAGSHTAISCSNLYATCSARSLLLRSRRSSLVSTRTGGGVSLGSYKKYTLFFRSLVCILFNDNI